MTDLVSAFRELDAADLDCMADVFYRLTETAFDVGKDNWAQVYALIACAAIDALDAQ
ncbi:hypothetical protein [Micromonospora auratinigra]|uniref:Uncharacterized protein n=1 Tax=Micromonospora auratinigra TaxID=261654 RepID=A0A1A9A790_9ACTN|nr:hypothetical protein [Micromonospora auratinigra]SBT51979.1 hypothetical protein GA0070611_5437 [Micromonospora auratinigra]